jgi:catechol 1,2-dioxygenase
MTTAVSKRALLIILFLFTVFNAQAEAVCSPTQNDVEGPYYLPDAPFRTQIAVTEEPGERITIKGAVLADDCKTPLNDALIEIWQTDSNGRYYYKQEGYRLRGQFRAGKNGSYEFTSVKPGRYGIGSGFRPAHIHIKVSHPKYSTVTTQLYFRGDPYLWPNDACGRGCRSNDPNRIIELKKTKDVLEGVFTIILKPVKK